MRCVRRITQWGYANVAKPILFRRKPDAVHHSLIHAARRVQRIPLVRSLPKLWQFQHDMLHTEVVGILFRNPVGLSAGFDKTLETPALMKNVGFGWMTGGSVTLGKYEGNEKPWFHRLPKSKSLVVNAGLPSEGTPVVSARVVSYPEQLFETFPLNVSVAKTNSRDSVGDEAGIKDYCESLAVFETLVQVKMLEINISCPNTFGGEPFTTAERLEKLLVAVDDLRLTKPVFIKMPINLSTGEFDALLAIIAQHVVAGVTIGNLMKDRAKVKLKEDLPETVKGNLSGKPAKEITTELVRRTYQQYGDRLAIIGVGGIMSADDAYEKIRAGASLVALITGMIFEGPQLVGDINRGLVKLLKYDGFASVADAVGTENTK